METYKEMKDRHQAEVNALPLAFAFSRDQYHKKLKEWNISEEEARAGAIVGIGGGGFVRAEDHNKVLATFRRIEDERRAAIEADHDGTGFIYEMFLYELANHEYGYTGDVSETLDALNITEADLNSSEAMQTGLKRAAEKINSYEPFNE